MACCRRSLRWLAVLSVLLLVGAPGQALGQAATPAPLSGSCDAAAPSIADLQSLIGSSTAGTRFSALPDGMPDGTAAGSKTAAKIVATLADYSACVASGDAMRQIGFFSGNFLASLAAAAGLPASQVSEQAVQVIAKQYAATITAVRHLRMIEKKRAALVVATTSYDLYYVELVSSGGRWLIDDVAPLPADADGPTGFFGQTYTDPFAEVALEWDATWSVLTAKQAPMISDLALTDGDGVFMLRWSFLGVENLQADASLAQCVGAPSALSFTVSTVDPASIAVALDKKQRPQRGVSKTSAFAVYDLAYYPKGDFDTAGSAANGTPQAERLYVECRVIPETGALIQINHLVPAADYNAQATARKTLLATLEL